MGDGSKSVMELPGSKESLSGRSIFRSNVARLSLSWAMRTIVGRDCAFFASRVLSLNTVKKALTKIARGSDVRRGSAWQMVVRLQQ